MVGAGVAGAFAAYSLRQELGPQVEIVVWERQARPGGRVGEMEFAGRRVETGATLIHSSNRYLVRAMERLGVHPTRPGDRKTPRRRLGIWNGVSFDLLASTASLPLALALARRYGRSLWRARRLAREAVARLVRLYEKLEGGRGFPTPGETYRDLGLYDLTQEARYGFVARHGVGDRFVREFSDGVARSNYGQDGRMNAWATLVSLIGGGVAGGHLFSVQEGNLRIVEGLLAASAAHGRTNLAARRVAARTGPRGEPAGYTVAAAGGLEEAFDAVILAVPLELAGVEFEGLRLPASATVRRRYQVTHTTFVAGRLRAAAFRLPEREGVPELILTRERPSIPFSAIGWLGPAEGDDRSVGGRGVYKVFSRRPLDDALLDRLFADRAETARLVWDAYPVLTPARVWPPFRLAHGLYYVNSMESAVSAMETEAMAARNAVNLLAQDLAENNR